MTPMEAIQSGVGSLDAVIATEMGKVNALQVLRQGIEGMVKENQMMAQKIKALQEPPKPALVEKEV